MVPGRSSTICRVASRPVDARQVDVHEDELGLALERRRDRLLAGRRLGDDLEAGGERDDGPGDVPKRRLVVHDQHSDGRGAFDHGLLGLHLIIVSPATWAAQRAPTRAGSGASPLT